MIGLLTVDELTPEALDGLTRAGLDDLLPHRLAVTFPGGASTGIWSGTPLVDPEKIEDFSFELLGATGASGDFNATLDQPQFRRLLARGFRDASEQTGAGYQPTYPTDKHVPPFLMLDHVVTRGVEARSARTLDLPGSDHRALLVTLAVPRA